MHITLILCCRSGVLLADELDSDSVESVDFLVAKLKRIQSEMVLLRMVHVHIVDCNDMLYCTCTN